VKLERFLMIVKMTREQAKASGRSVAAVRPADVSEGRWLGMWRHYWTHYEGRAER